MREETLNSVTIAALAAIAVAAATLCIQPAHADTANGVTLLIENDAGMVTQVSEMTRRECDAAAALLNSRKSDLTTFALSQTCCAISINPLTKAATSHLTSARCVLATDKASDKP